MSVIVSVTPVAVAVAAAEISTDVAELIVVIVAPAGMDPPAIVEPTSAFVKFAVADVTVVLEAVVAPSVTDRTGAGDTMAADGVVDSVRTAEDETGGAPVPSEPPAVARPHVRTCHSICWLFA